MVYHYAISSRLYQTLPSMAKNVCASSLGLYEEAMYQKIGNSLNQVDNTQLSQTFNPSTKHFQKDIIKA